MKVKKYLWEFTQIIIGAAIISLGVKLFLLPNQLSSGGFTGLGTVLYYLFKIPIGTIVIITNIPLFIIAFFKIGKTFLVKALVGTAALSIILDIIDTVAPLTDDRFLGCIYGGIVVGIGTAIILRVRASTGGSDLLTNIIKQYKPGLKMSTVLVILDIIIVGVNVIFFREIEIGLYSAITIYISGKIIDIFFEGVYFTKVMYIISNKYEEIAERIGKEVERGVTGLHGKGMYTNEEKMMLFCVISRREVMQVREIIKPIDPEAFIVISNAREAFGLGFKKS